MEGDDSPQPARLQAIITELCGFLNALVAEETAEILSGTEIQPDTEAPMSLAASIGSLDKAAATVVRELMDKIEKAGARHDASHQLMMDVAAMASKRAMGMDGAKKSDRVHMANFNKAVLDAGACDLGADGREMLTNSNPVQGAAEATQHATTDTSGNPMTPVPNPTGAVPAISAKAAAVSGVLDGMVATLAKAADGMKPHQQLMRAAHDAIKAVSAGATCKGGGRPSHLNGGDMANLDTAHYHFGKMKGMKCDAADKAANPVPGGSPLPEGEDEDQGTVDTSKAMPVADLVKVDPYAELAKALRAEFAAQGADTASAIKSIAETLGAVSKRVEDIASQPTAPLTIAKGTIVAEKSGGNGAGDALSDEAIQAAIAKMSPEEIQIAMIKGVQRAGPDPVLSSRYTHRPVMPPTS